MILLLILLAKIAFACNPTITCDSAVTIYGDTDFEIDWKAGALVAHAPYYCLYLGFSWSEMTFTDGRDSLVVDMLCEGCYMLRVRDAGYPCSTSVLIHRFDFRLPVELLGFWAESDKGVMLYWQVASETGEPQYEVYRENALLRRIPGGQRNYHYHDRSAQPNREYEYRLACLEEDGSRETIATTTGCYRLETYAEPLVECSATQVTLALPQSMCVDMRVYNILGQQVAVLANGQQFETGTHYFSFDGSSLAPDIYFVRSSFDGAGSVTKKMLLVK